MSSPKCLSIFPENPGGCRSVNANNTNTSPSEEIQTIIEQPRERVMRESHRDRRPRLPRDFTIHLPEGILQNIFSFVPVKEAARLSLLGRSYKNSVFYSRKLEFDLAFAKREDFLPVVNHIFNHHEGPAIQSLQIHFDPSGVEECALKWIEKAVQKGVEEIDLNFFISSQPFRLPVGFLNIETIRVLKLHFFEIAVPPQLTGLRFLKTLVLRKAVNVTDTLIENIIEHCMLLECLDLTQCDQILRLNIYAVNHKSFKILKIGDCPRLDRIDIHAPRLRTFHYLGCPATFKILLPVSEVKDLRFHLLPCQLLLPYFPGWKLLHAVDHVTEFTTSGAFLECLRATKMKEGATCSEQLVLRHLKELQVITQGASHIDIYDMVCFLSRCPRLENLFIDLNGFFFACGVFFKMHHKEPVERYNEPFGSLKIIKLKGFKYWEQEVELVKLLLRTTPSLEHLILVTAKRKRKKLSALEAYYHDLICCCNRASPYARFTICQYDNDESSIVPKHPELWF